ncbi:MAG UNVERIFIED_CONTAM: hypothetical protein LVT10_08580 [Anaerolineae bacterium]|jgi:ribonucleoside-diphosphate reductase alpha chain
MRQLTQSNTLNELGYKIFLDRYALKDGTRASLTVGDVVVVVINEQSGQREIGKVVKIQLPKVTVELLNGEQVERDLEHVDKPLETHPDQMMDRVAWGVAQIEPDPEQQTRWQAHFRWLLDDWKFVPGGRILTAAGTDQNLTYYNCYVIESPERFARRHHSYAWTNDRDHVSWGWSGHQHLNLAPPSRLRQGRERAF